MRAVVLGCGYVGLELGRRLAAAGHEVTGVRRSREGAAAVAEAGLDAVRADVTDPDSLAAVPDADWLVFSVSAGRGGAAAAREAYVDGLATVVEGFGARKAVPDRLVYTSSTGVYGDRDGEWVDEETPTRPGSERARVLLEAERVATERAPAAGIDATVVRFSGLYGPGRYRLSRYLDGPITEGVLNAVHRDDAAGAVAHLLESDRARGETVLVTDDEPVSKWEFADWLADRCGVDRPPKLTTEAYLQRRGEDASERVLASKRCSNTRLRALGYDLTYPTVREGYRAAVEAYRGEA
ncbi:MAG: SDR family oxidoreductase [Salinigranum sp.]